MTETDLSRLKSIRDVDVAGRRVLVRVDLNVPMRDGEVTDATRIERVLPTIRDLGSRGAKVVLLSHYGRPKGERKSDMSLEPVARRLGEMLNGTTVTFATDCVGEAAATAVGALGDGDVAVLENLRFHPGEEANDAAFARKLAENGDLYVNDAFSAAHRAHASTEAITRVLPAYTGLAMQAELDGLKMALQVPKRPVAAVVGGAKVSTKIDLLTNLTRKADVLIIGGGMANTFLFAGGYGVANSLCEKDQAGTIEKVLSQAAENGCQIMLPCDVVVAKAFKEGSSHKVVGTGAVPEDMMILDVGPQTVSGLKARIADCATVLWNGPLGAFEVAPFGEGTFELAREAARLTRDGELITVAGGGDTVAALNAAGVADDFTYVSTAGGAFLEWLEGRTLPGVAALARH